MYYTEAKPQCWRAVAILEDRGERLIYLGRSSTQVRAGFLAAYLELFDDEERDRVVQVALQRWNGAPDAGQWVHQAQLTIPASAKLAQCA